MDCVDRFRNGKRGEFVEVVVFLFFDRLQDVLIVADDSRLVQANASRLCAPFGDNFAGIMTTGFMTGLKAIQEGLGALAVFPVVDLRTLRSILALFEGLLGKAVMVFDFETIGEYRLPARPLRLRDQLPRLVGQLSRRISFHGDV